MFFKICVISLLFAFAIAAGTLVEMSEMAYPSANLTLTDLAPRHPFSAITDCCKQAKLVKQAKVLFNFKETKIILDQRGAPCTTPHGETVTCVSLLSCLGLLKLLLEDDSDGVEFVKRSQCGYDAEPLVCCRFSDYSPGIFDVFTKTPEKTGDVTTPEPVLQAQMNLNMNVLPNTTECGWEKESNEVLPEAMTDFVEFPWLAALEYKNKITGKNAGIRCTGTIINNRFILTAAQCIVDPELEISHVWLGDWKFSTDPDCRKRAASVRCADKVQKAKIEYKIPHPFFSRKLGGNDIGLLRVKNEIKYTDYIRPICLPTFTFLSPKVGTRLSTAGWGATRCGHSSDMKLKRTVRLAANQVCKKHFLERQVTVNEMCVVGQQEKEAYKGDSGGPLMNSFRDEVTKESRWYQEGVASWGDSCADPGNPLVYVRISRYIQWILNTLQED